jgi:hypothetical protein
MTNTELLNLHQQAMFFAQDALVATQHKETEKAFELNQKAFELERQVALSLVESKNEPFRSIILRSAASLALDIGNYREAEIFISYGLLGTPPDDIHQELLALLDGVKQQRLLKNKNETITLIGYLQIANARTNKIRLVNGTENKDIIVTFGLADMVRTFFDNKVRALVRKTRGNQYELINLIKEE